MQVSVLVSYNNNNLFTYLLNYLLTYLFTSVFIARRYTNAVYAVTVFHDMFTC